MKIVHVITRLIVGGAQENTLLSCEGQHDRGHDVTLITGPSVGPEGSLMARATSYGYRVVPVDALHRSIGPADVRAYRELVRTLRELKPDVVHTHSSKAGILGRYAAKTAGCRNVVHTIHGLAFTASTRPAVNNVYKYLERRAAPLTNTIVCVADAMRDQSLAAGIGRAEQYVTVYSGMETRPFLDPPVPRETTRAALGLSPDHVVVGTIARLFDLKGHDDLIDLAPDLCRRFPRLRFLWVGDGSLRQKLQARIESIGLTDRFLFAGLVPPARVPELTAAMDVLVHPSRREGLARALPQGQLAGCPVVTYDIDGNREGLINGETGYLVRPFDVAGLGDKLATLLADPDQARAMGQAGRVFAAGRFDTKVMVDALDDVYRSSLSRYGREVPQARG
ncbi:MAG TPA: glycosyltransferase family 4 protein [Tepidisphaeraceae bacterium]|jgi:glycosyltransferase involved in cell wall biosynthesis